MVTKRLRFRAEKWESGGPGPDTRPLFSSTSEHFLWDELAWLVYAIDPHKNGLCCDEKWGQAQALPAGAHGLELGRHVDHRLHALRRRLRLVLDLLGLVLLLLVLAVPPEVGYLRLPPLQHPVQIPAVLPQLALETIV